MIFLRIYIIHLCLLLAVGPAHAAPSGSVSISGNSFVSPDYNLTDRRVFNYISAEYKNLSQDQAKDSSDSTETRLNVDVRGQFAPDAQSMSYINVSEMYVQGPYFSMGRKKFEWSRLDDNWGLGLFDPMFRWNTLMPEKQGSTGLFIEIGSKDPAVAPVPFGFVLFGSFLFIPDQGASYALVDGQFQSVNPWFKVPVRSIYFPQIGGAGPIYYDVKIPDLNEVLFKTSFAAQMYVGDKTKGLVWQTAFARKPSNQLGIAAFAEPDPSQRAVYATISPKIYMNSVLSSDLIWNGKNWSAGLTVVRDRPEDPSFPELYTYKTFSGSTLTSPYVQAIMGPVRAKVSALSINGLQETVHGNLNDQLGSALPPRFPFEKAWKAEMSTRIGRSVAAYGSYLAGFKDEYSMVSLGASWQIDRSWRLTSDLLLVRADDTELSKKSIFYNFQNNDSYAIGVSYVF